MADEPVAVAATPAPVPPVQAQPAPTPAPATSDPVPVGDAKPTIASEKAESKTEAAALFDPKTYKAPEGASVDEKTLSDYAAIVNDDKLSPSERGTKMLDLYNSAMKTVGESYTKAWTDTNEKWVNEVKADPEIGGSKFEPTKQMISKAIDTMGPTVASAFRQSLDITGVGNNPAFIRGLAVMAKALTEGSHVAGGPPSGKEKSVAEIFYPSMNQKDS
jgi:hypothetical protein